MSSSDPITERTEDEIRRLRARLAELLESAPPFSETSSEASLSEADFIQGGGECGALVREFDWSKTSVGSPQAWPHSLKTSLRTILHSRYPMFIWWGPQLINFYNDGYIPMLGKRHPAALGKPASTVWAEIWDEVGRQAAIVMHEGTATWNEELLLVMQRHGYTEETYFTFSYSPVFDDQGKIGGIFCPVIEDTERVLSERRMRCLRQIAAQTSKARTANEACHAASATLAEHRKDVSFALIYLLEKDGRAQLITSVGVAAGTSQAPEFITPDSTSQPWPLRDILEGRSTVMQGLDGLGLPGGIWTEPAHTAILLPLSKGLHERPRGFLVLGASPLLQFDDKYREFFELLAGGVAASIANAEGYQEEKRRAEALAELDHAKTAFFSNVSHEFRTPLTLLLGPLEELRAKKGRSFTASDWAQLDLIQRNGLRLLRLVNSLLDFSRIEAGRTQAAYASTDLAALTASLANAFRSVIESAGMELIIDCPPLPEPVYVDRDMWEKIVLNLVSNAFKFSFEGRIEVSLHAEDGRAVLRIRDTGTGMPEDQLPHIFERFHRIEGARGRTIEGTGIGLSLVKELIELHQGKIAAQSVLGKGSTFTVEIPFGADHLPPDRVAPAQVATSSTSIQPEAYVAEASQWKDTASETPSQAAQEGTGRILLVDDNADMREYLGGLMRQRYAVDTLADGSAALAAILKDPPDLVIADIMMPGLNGLELLRAIRETARTRTLPVILLSARAGEEALVEGLEHGADDYLVKPFAARQVLARVAAHLEIGRLRRASEIRFRQLFAANVIGVVSGDSDTILEANDAFLSMLGLTSEEVEKGDLHWSQFTPQEYHEADQRQVEQLLATGICGPFEKELSRQDGSRVPVLVGATLVNRSPMRWLCFVVDLTERRELEKRLFEKQKFESIGLLAGGIAHDFNNLLVGILGNASLVQEMTPAKSEISPLLEDIIAASERAAHLTRQMLAYSGKGKFVLESLNLSQVVREMRNLLHASVPHKVKLHFDLRDDIPATEADSNQIQQIVMNLVLNAAEAIGEGSGSIVVRTAARNIDATYIHGQLGKAEVEPGTYVMLEVIDTGCGMDEETLARIFDPFFTTKFTGRGLGLAAVAGIVRGHKGAIRASSEPGKGSTFLVLFPAVDLTIPVTEPQRAHGVAELEGAGTILFVDDEDVVRRTAKLGLERRGYRVLEAASGAEGIDILKREINRIAAIVLDLSMPGMSGNETLPHLRRIKPDVKVIVSSGYSEAETMRLFAGQSISGFLQKPYSSPKLAETLKKTLDKV
jgi:PAS domain S-box-containing protein